MHTKGPWEARNVGRGMKVWKGIRIIADTTREPMPIEEAQANARLIAAAPELLEAMRKSFDILGNIPEDLSNWNETNSAIQEAHDILDEAIHKAKGE